jgi:hypothetical protein
MRRESSADYTLTAHQSSGAAVIGPRVFLTGVQSHNDTGSNVRFRWISVRHSKDRSWPKADGQLI